eukprot:TRINITY_DN56097_c0_g1_i1.p1 TRINITY_DN56097_c0_g1~~TRINITY_DN56097_c0_g1_i1.p1  ORF type:complete len:806 (-),score=58.78 TRINITY_DN56097_c0_g1_i1:36-2453(-)
MASSTRISPDFLSDRLGDIELREDSLAQQFTHLNSEHNRLLDTVNRLNSAINDLDERSSPPRTPVRRSSPRRTTSPLSSRTTTVRTVRKSSRSPSRRNSPRQQSQTTSTSALNMALVTTTGIPPSPRSPIRSPGYRRSPTRLSTRLQDLEHQNTAKTAAIDGLQSRNDQLHHQVLHLQSRNDSLAHRLDHIQADVLDAKSFTFPESRSRSPSPIPKLVAPSPRSSSPEDVGRAAQKRMQSVDVILASYTQLRGTIETLKQDKIQLESALNQLTITQSDKDRIHAAEVTAAHKRAAEIEAQVLQLGETVDHMSTQKKSQESVLKEMSRRNRDLEEEIGRLQAELDFAAEQKAIQIAADHPMVERLRTDLHAAEAALADLQAKHMHSPTFSEEALAREVDQLRNENERLKDNELNNLENQASEVEQHKLAKKYADRRLDDVQRECEELRDEVTTLRLDNSTLKQKQKELEHADDTIRRATNRAEAAEDRVADLRDQVNSLQRALHDSSSSNAAQSIEDLMKHNKALEDKLANSREEHAAVCKHLQDKVEGLLQRVDQLKETIANSSSDRDDQEKEMSQLKQTIASLNAKIADFESEGDKQHQQLDTLRTENQELQNTIANMDDERVLAKKLHDADVQQHKLVYATCNGLTKEKEALEAQNEELKEKLKECEAITEAQARLEDELASLRDAKQTLQDQVSQLRQTQEQTEDDRVKTKAALDSTQEVKKQIEDELATLHKQNGALSTQVMELQAEVDKWKKANRALQQDVDGANNAAGTKKLCLEQQLRWLEQLQDDVYSQISTVKKQL